ncbi:interleukin-18 receptor accessory protein [Pleurodeles waltl]|uniref:interleukin-18 receptor accessory protein n=1 Tax=Pleurodeles waltl TaxID=8319 RepID=UPI0037098652
MELTFIVFWTLMLIKHAEGIRFPLSGCSESEPAWRYHAFNEEDFFFQCAPPASNPKNIFNTSSSYNKDVEWFRVQEDKGLVRIDFTSNANITQKGNSLWFLPIGIKDSGTYICTVRKELLCLKIILDVEDKNNANCSNFNETKLYFFIATGNSLYCPSLNCYKGSQRSSVKWYKGGNLMVPDKNRYSLEIKEDEIVWTEIYEQDSGIYACDYIQFNKTDQWIVRSVVSITAIVRDTVHKPVILDPTYGQRQEVELGKPFELKCKVIFGFEMNSAAFVTWLRSNSRSTGNQLQQENKEIIAKKLAGTEYVHMAKLEKVTENDLQDTFICFAQNSVGNSSVEVKLVKINMDKVVLVYILCITIAFLLATFIASGLIYVYWIEIILLFRNYISNDETIGDSKEFDAFVSYAKSNSYSDENSMNENYNEEEFAIKLLPEILEDKYGYKLCLLERDIPPGGAYVEDIARIIKRSRRAIFVLSPTYINDPSLFELQTAVKCTLENGTPKLIFIKFKTFQEPRSLPHAIKRALKVVPTVSWKEKYSKTTSSASRFWNKIRYHMPIKKSPVSKDKYTW